MFEPDECLRSNDGVSTFLPESTTADIFTTRPHLASVQKLKVEKSPQKLQSQEYMRNLEASLVLVLQKEQSQKVSGSANSEIDFLTATNYLP